MKQTKNRMLRQLIITGLLLLLSVSLSADLFENYSRGGRALGMGGAFVGLADDVYAVVYNPAGLGGQKGVAVNFNYQPVMGYDDIATLGALFRINFGNIGIGGSFYQIAQDGGTSFSTVNLAGGMALPGLKMGPVSNLRVGVVANLYIIQPDGFSPTDNVKDSATAFSFGISALVNLFSPKFSVGFYVNNINQPNISVTETGGGTDIKREARIGLSYLLNEYFRLSLDYAIRDYAGETEALNNIFIGSEIYFYKAVMLRFGFDEGKMTIGLGIDGKNFELNGAVRVEPDINLYYQFDLTLKLN